MNLQTMWVMFYFIPSMDGYRAVQQPTEAINTVKQVEKQKNNQIKEEYVQEKSQRNLRLSKKFQKKNQHFEHHIGDSSFFVPQGSINKATEQKVGRNSVSNILRLFAKMLKSPVFKEIYWKIRNRYNILIGLKQFFSWTNSIGLLSNKYIRIKKILKGIRTKQEYGRMLSIMFSTFVAEFAREAVLTSSKTESKNIFPTMNQIRKIKQEINQAVKNVSFMDKQNKKNVFN